MQSVHGAVTWVRSWFSQPVAATATNPAGASSTTSTATTCPCGTVLVGGVECPTCAPKQDVQVISSNGASISELMIDGASSDVQRSVYYTNVGGGARGVIGDHYTFSTVQAEGLTVAPGVQVGAVRPFAGESVYDPPATWETSPAASPATSAVYTPHAGGMVGRKGDYVYSTHPATGLTCGVPTVVTPVPPFATESIYGTPVAASSSYGTPMGSSGFQSPSSSIVYVDVAGAREGQRGGYRFSAVEATGLTVAPGVAVGSPAPVMEPFAGSSPYGGEPFAPVSSEPSGFSTVSDSPVTSAIYTRAEGGGFQGQRGGYVYSTYPATGLTVSPSTQRPS